HGRVEIATGEGLEASRITIETRHLTRGLRELPPVEDRLDLAGPWGFTGGPFQGQEPAAAQTTRVPGHVIYDCLVPEDGVATFHRSFELPDSWSGRAVFVRSDGAYGRAEVRVNGELAGC